jgi:hypothetical protein
LDYTAITYLCNVFATRVVGRASSFIRRDRSLESSSIGYAISIRALRYMPHFMEAIITVIEAVEAINLFGLKLPSK